MKKLLISLILLYVILLSSCISTNNIIIDTRKDIQSFETKLEIINVFYVEENSVYIWNTIFLYEKYQPIQCNVMLQIEDTNIKSIIESGNYEIYAKIYVDIQHQVLLIYPVWISSNKKINTKLQKLDLLENSKDI